MKYRVVERADGTFKAQFHVWFFNWEDSAHPTSTNRDEVVSFALTAMGTSSRASRVVRVVWPPRAGRSCPEGGIARGPHSI